MNTIENNNSALHISNTLNIQCTIILVLGSGSKWMLKGIL